VRRHGGGSALSDRQRSAGASQTRGLTARTQSGNSAPQRRSPPRDASGVNHEKGRRKAPARWPGPRAYSPSPRHQSGHDIKQQPDCEVGGDGHHGPHFSGGRAHAGFDDAGDGEHRRGDGTRFPVRTIRPMAVRTVETVVTEAMAPGSPARQGRKPAPRASQELAVAGADRTSKRTVTSQRRGAKMVPR